MNRQQIDLPHFDTYFRVRYSCSSLPTRMTQHALIQHLFDTLPQDVCASEHARAFKVYSMGRDIFVESPYDLARFGASEYTWTHRVMMPAGLPSLPAKAMVCRLESSEEVPVTQYKTGDYVALTGLISYRINQKNASGKRRFVLEGGERRDHICPVFLGRFVRAEGQTWAIKDHFLNHIQETLGVRIQGRTLDCFDRLPMDVISQKITLHNLISIDALPAVVTDPKKFARLQYQSFFLKKSYGLGGFSVDRLVDLSDKEEMDVAEEA